MPEISLSFDAVDKSSHPIAIVKGGKFDRETLYLNQGESIGRRPKFQPDIGRAYLSKMTSRKHGSTMKLINEAMSKGIPVEHLLTQDKGVKSMYEDILNQQKQSDKCIKLPPESTFQLIPPEDKRFVYYIAGPSGSGKSYIAKALAERYQKQFPDRDVFLVSKLGEDETLDSMKHKPIRLNVQKLIEEPLKNLEPLRESLVIFDDVDGFDKKQLDAIQLLVNDIGTMGRHTDTSMIYISHILSDYKRTRLLLLEATHFILYPAATSAHAMTYLLKNNVGADKNEITKMRKCGSRWICVSKQFPTYVVTEHSAWIMHQNEEED